MTMNDDVEIQQGEKTPGNEADGPVAGERLADGRRELKISVVEIAKELHLDEPKVRALERNEFDILGAPVFAKGHLKKYAQLVGVDPDDVLTDYYRLTRDSGIPPVVSKRQKPRRELSPGPWIAVIVVVIVVVSVFWWFTSRPVAHVPAAVPRGQPPVEQELETVAVPPPGAEEAVPEDVAPQQSQPVAEAPPQPAVAAGQMHVLLIYSGDCWTEITDASGRRLLFALGKDGRSVELSGAEPFNVLFGSPGNVSLRVNGEDYPLPASARPDRPLRLTISGS